MAARKKTSKTTATEGKKRAPKRSRKKKAPAVKKTVVAESKPVSEGPTQVEAQPEPTPEPEPTPMPEPEPPKPEPESELQTFEVPLPEEQLVKERRAQNRADRMVDRQRKIEEARARGAAEDAERERRQAVLAEEKRNRVRARQARQQAMQLEQERKARGEPEQEPACEVAQEENTPPALRVVKSTEKPIDLSEARRKRAEKEDATFTVDFPEALSWKYMTMQERRNGLTAIIQRQVVAAFQKKLEAQILATCKASPAWVQANDEMHVVINEILDTIEPSLPEGYSVDIIEPKDHTAVVKHNPAGVGKRMKLSTDERG